MHTYRIYWNDGRIETITGSNSGQALMNAGYDNTVALPYWKIETVS